MSVRAENHIDDNALDQYAMGWTAADELVMIEEHLLVCGDCRDRFQLTDDFIAALRALMRKPGPERAS